MRVVEQTGTHTGTSTQAHAHRHKHTGTSTQAQAHRQLIGTEREGGGQHPQREGQHTGNERCVPLVLTRLRSGLSIKGILSSMLVPLTLTAVEV